MGRGAGAGAGSAKRKEPEWMEVMRSAKARHRPRLKDWGADGFATRRAEDFARLSKVEHGEPITRLDSLTPDEFAERFERASEPVIVKNVPAAEGWAADGWTYDAFAREYGAMKLKCGEDDDGKTIRVAARDFCSYVAGDSMRDDSPLYVFDGCFGDRGDGKSLLDHYKPPKFCGRDDLFELVGEGPRPPYRWLLLGPKRSGTCVHVDPLGTSAWNTVLKGRKRWVLFEPGTTKSVATGSKLVEPGEDDEAVHYFADILPRVRRAHPQARRIECVQEPGETIYVPGGWWHAVLNLDDSVGVTQNYCSRENFRTVWDKTRSGRKGMARLWLRKLRAHADPAIRALADVAARQPPVPKVE